MLALKAGPMREHDYATLFKLEHMLKDVRLCLEEGQAAGVPFPAAAAVREALTAGMGRGLGDADFAAARRDGRGSRRRAPLGALIRPSIEVSMPSAALARKGAQLRQFLRTSREESVSTRADVIPGDTPGTPRRRLTLLGGLGRVARCARAARRRAKPASRSSVRGSRPLPTAAGSAARKVRGIVGVLVDPAETPDGTGFLRLRRRLRDARRPRSTRARSPAGASAAIAHRESPGVAGGYLANGCIECDALIGRFQLEDLLHEHLQAGGTYAQLDIGVPVELPAVALAHRLTAHA